MTLNIDERRKSSSLPDISTAPATVHGPAAIPSRSATAPEPIDAATGAPAPPAGTRAALIDELVGEMTGWAPRDRMGAFRMWHRGALSLVHLNVVSALEAEGPLPMRRLAEALDVSDASATGIVDRMERRGLLIRRHDAGDRRLVLVHLTDQGSGVFQNLEAHRRTILSSLLGELSEEELNGFLAGVRALRAARSRLYGSPSHAPAEPGGPPAPDGSSDRPTDPPDETA